MRPGNLEQKTTSISNAGDPYPRVVDYSPAELHHPAGAVTAPGTHRSTTNPRARHATSPGQKPGPTRITVPQDVPTAGPTPAQIFPWSDPRDVRLGGSTSLHTGRTPLWQAHTGRAGHDTAQRKLLSPTRTTEIQAGLHGGAGTNSESCHGQSHVTTGSTGPPAPQLGAGPWRTNFSAIAHARAGRGLVPSAQRQPPLSQGHRADDRSELEATLVPDSFHCK